ncbi:pre-mRNA splicing regulator USH1G [Topomyia yanbarensis]|uniref:pre-mRNA splicing regulator USH1G n=1 Tax=Topomyia yanbarensis TaxID=2498891 RepID=UPI00273A9EFF|nr:pre-mRNA splicing regulator USH1G [Topomyia yanbarensis]XP_058832681.1 pre-mRNA splicing regulator USH1G [Topomyia yanbarensis]XP_058832682.1 pre-mRNA splicing regulator USH1G [Topomyia yanbarensis]XP_058832684.1 pre-mRNA splicing regulator USH1G [Topomyia yanbarensis]XP_058832685.1 pre-mRNA splicing regulator USH1G [Topomyia yanbarensis]XP_058832686.1 pre-mRNA splicing regulator USH1G [Topomyia yanbarensis]
MSSDRIHRAAKDGLLDVLKEATRSEANSKDVDGMTPVLWAAFEGRLEALKLLVGRGGDPDKSDQFGNTALHLASAKGHMQCVDFLVQFGANLYALDIDKHSAKDLAAINNRDNILRYLDAAAGNLEVIDKKKVRNLKEQAKKKSEKQAREFAIRQQKIDQAIEDGSRVRPHRPSNVLQLLKHKIWSGSQGNLKNTQKEANQNSTKFSALVGGTVTGAKGAVKKRAEATKLKQQLGNGGFKIGEVEPTGKRSVRSIQGLQRDSEILYVGTYSSDDNSKRGQLKDVFDVDSNGYEEVDDDDSENGCSNVNKFNTISRSVSQPDFLANLNDDLTNDVLLQSRPSIFNRPSGNLAMTRSVSTVLANLANENSANESPDGSMKTKAKLGPIKPRSQLVISDSESEHDSSDNEENESLAVLRFLFAFKLEDHYPIFQKNEIDMETLMLLTEGDIKSLGLPIGPHRRLCNAIQERKEALASPGTIMDSRL